MVNGEKICLRFLAVAGVLASHKKQKNKFVVRPWWCWISVSSGGVSGWVGVYGGVQGGTDWCCARASKSHTDFEMGFPFLMHHRLACYLGILIRIIE